MEEESLESIISASANSSDFQKHTSKLQTEISELNNQGISEDSEDGSEWSQINDILVKHNFSAIKLLEEEELPDMDSLLMVIWELLKDYSAKKQEIDQLRVSLRRLRKDNKLLSERIKSPRQILSPNLHKTRHEDKEIGIFRGFMKRDYNPKRQSDSDILGVIVYYEEQKQKTLEDYKVFKNELEKTQKTLKDLEQQSNLVILNEVAQELAVNSVEEIPAAIHKMQQVFFTLPTIEKFIEDICKVAEFSNPQLDLITELLTTWKNERIQIHQLLQTSDFSLVLEKADAIAYFYSIFEVKNEPPKKIIEQLFYFVHEIKVFLAVSVRQFARKQMGFPSSTSVTAVLEAISKSISK